MGHHMVIGKNYRSIGVERVFVVREIIFYLDFDCPYAWLVFQQLPQTLEGLDCEVRYRPIALTALLKHEGALEAEAGAKYQAWVSRHVQWIAQQHGLHLAQPAQRVFHTLPLLRLAHQCTFTGETNRWVTECIFRHVWSQGAEADDPLRLQALQDQLQRFWDAAPTAPERARLQLRDMTQQAMDAGAFGVPTLVCDGQLFWGWDALAMLRSHLLQCVPQQAQP